MSTEDRPLRIGVLFHNRLIEKIPSTMRIEVTNLLEEPLIKVSVVISCSGLEPIHWSAKTLERWKLSERRLEVLPRNVGVFVAQIHAEAWSKKGDRYQGNGCIHSDIEIFSSLPLSQVGGIVIPFPPGSFQGGDSLEKIFEEVDLAWEYHPVSEPDPFVEEEKTPSSPVWPGECGEWSQISGTSFHIMRTQVSQQLWERIMREPLEQWLRKRDESFVTRSMNWFDPEMPVFGVTHAEARLFCEHLTAYAERNRLLSQGWVFRLPTVQEWRLACGPIPDSPTHRWCYNLSLPEYRACKLGPLPVLGNQGVQTRLEPNGHGLYAMLGNLFEWCAMEHDRQTDPHRRKAFLLGGSWHAGEDENHRKPEFHLPAAVDQRSSRFGFRPVAINYHQHS